MHTFYSIEACENSQFQQHINSILNLSLGSSKTNINAIMVNLVGEENSKGIVIVPIISKMRVKTYKIKSQFFSTFHKLINNLFFFI